MRAFPFFRFMAAEVAKPDVIPTMSAGLFSGEGHRMSQVFGVIGLEVMGRNIALNIERNGFPIAVYNRTYSKTQEFLSGVAKGKQAKGAEKIGDFVQLLERPRRILIMVKAGAPVDAVIKELRPFLQDGDIVIDGGNSF